jgi:hypothetical protein
LGKTTPRDTAPVDAQLKGGGGDHARQPTGLQLLLDQAPLLACHGAVVRLGDHFRRAAGESGLTHQLGRHPVSRRCWFLNGQLVEP